MCLVLFVVLAGLSVQFFLDGLVLQGAIMALLAVLFLVLMVRNIACVRGQCDIRKGKADEETPSE